MQQRAIFVNVTTPLQNWCRDVKDNYLLALSKDADADYLITDDKTVTLSKNNNSGTRRVMTVRMGDDCEDGW